MDRISDDLRLGAAAIAEEVFGDPTKERKVYPLKDELGLFWVGGQLAGLASKMREIMEKKAAAAAAAASREDIAIEDPIAARKTRDSQERVRPKAIKRDRVASDAA
jgi:hypothetical protein